jgi:hypothetical protein
MTTWSDHCLSQCSGAAGDHDPRQTGAGERPPGRYVTEISVPDFGDGGIQRLHSKPLGEEGEREMKLHMTDAEYEKAAAEFGAQYRAELEALGVGGTVPIAPAHPGGTGARGHAGAAAEVDGPEREAEAE